MNINDLTPEQIERAKACKTSEDLLALAKERALSSPTNSYKPLPAAGYVGRITTPTTSAVRKCWGRDA